MQSTFSSKKKNQLHSVSNYIMCNILCKHIPNVMKIILDSGIITLVTFSVRKAKSSVLFLESRRKSPHFLGIFVCEILLFLINYLRAPWLNPWYCWQDIDPRQSQLCKCSATAVEEKAQRSGQHNLHLY